jgi:hypothetical protein
MRTSPSIVPHEDDRDTYLVLVEIGPRRFLEADGLGRCQRLGCLVGLLLLQGIDTVRQQLPGALLCIFALPETRVKPRWKDTGHKLSPAPDRAAELGAR